ncbi:uncharacterized protein si:ch211-198g14.4 [Danio rerio]|uniref:Uncharacterized protein si:ch211-198g14.4 n=2 Tax=Danio rerio TaxID=7955 RepID=A0AC58J4I8_DANRE
MFDNQTQKAKIEVIDLTVEEEEEEKIAGQQESLREEKFDAAPGTSAPKRPRIVYTPYVNKRQKISETPVQEEYDTDEDDDEDAESDPWTPLASPLSPYASPSEPNPSAINFNLSEDPWCEQGASNSGHHESTQGGAHQPIYPFQAPVEEEEEEEEEEDAEDVERPQRPQQNQEAGSVSKHSNIKDFYESPAYCLIREYLDRYEVKINALADSIGQQQRVIENVKDFLSEQQRRMDEKIGELQQLMGKSERGHRLITKLLIFIRHSLMDE